MIRPDNVKPFEEIKYTGPYGENCVATLKGDIVTIQGDRLGVSQAPLQDFLKEFVQNQLRVDLQRTPKRDTVVFSGKKSEQVLDDYNIKVNNGFLGLGKRKIKGNIAGKDVNLKLDSNLWGTVKLSGTINGEEIKLKLKGYKLTGDISDENKDMIPHLKVLMTDKRAYDEMAAVASVMI